MILCSTPPNPPLSVFSVVCSLLLSNFYSVFLFTDSFPLSIQTAVEPNQFLYISLSVLKFPCFFFISFFSCAFYFFLSLVFKFLLFFVITCWSIFVRASLKPLLDNSNISVIWEFSYIFLHSVSDLLVFGVLIFSWKQAFSYYVRTLNLIWTFSLSLLSLTLLCLHRVGNKHFHIMSGHSILFKLSL